MLIVARAVSERWLRGRLPLVAMLLGAMMVLAACGADSPPAPGEGEEGRRFVTEQRPTREPSPPPTATSVAQAIQPTAVPTVSAQQLLVTRSAPRFLYLMVDGQLTVYDASLRTFTAIGMPDSVGVYDFSPSPTGDRVGVLGVQDERLSVLFFGADGQLLGEPIALAVTMPLSLPVSPVASPVATAVTSVSQAIHIDWIPQGNAVLISGPGVLQRVSMDGSTMPVSRIGATGTVINGIWSPMDAEVVIQTVSMDGQHSVFVLDSGSDDVTEIDVLHGSSGSGVSNLQWLPTGLGLVMVAGNLDNSDLMNGQLYVYRFGDQVPMLVATSGQGGPAATITHAVVSPDGNSVAYAIMVRDLDDWYVHSLWVRPLEGGPGISLPVQSDAPITALVWGSEGLVWQQADGSITVIDGQLEPRTLGEEPAATPVASPLVSPIASPVEQATPRG